MAFFDDFTTALKQKWLQYYQLNHAWLALQMELESVNTPDGGRRPPSYLILGILNALEPKLAQLMLPFAKLNPDSDALIEVLELNFDPEVALGNRPATKQPAAAPAAAATAAAATAAAATAAPAVEDAFEQVGGDEEPTPDIVVLSSTTVVEVGEETLDDFSASDADDLGGIELDAFGDTSEEITQDNGDDLDAIALDDFDDTSDDLISSEDLMADDLLSEDVSSEDSEAEFGNLELDAWGDEVAGDDLGEESISDLGDISLDEFGAESSKESEDEDLDAFGDITFDPFGDPTADSEDKTDDKDLWK